VAEVVTLLLIIQYLEETDALDAIVVINHGRVNRRGTSAELKAATGAGGDRQRP
jgi:ABC-type multidrug transport system ATPase subunit